MKVTKEICSFNELWKQSWSGARDTLKKVMDNNMEDDLMNYLEMLFCKNSVDETTLNDYLRSDADEIFITLGIEEEKI